MPIYEYRCRQCGDKFEKLVRSSEAEREVKCPACQSPLVQRQVSVCGIISGGDSGGFSMDAPASSCAPVGGG